jgi:hypothetical protein
MELRVLILLYGVPEQPDPACRWQDFWHKTKGRIWLSHVTLVVVVARQQDDNKTKTTVILNLQGVFKS